MEQTRRRRSVTSENIRFNLNPSNGYPFVRINNSLNKDLNTMDLFLYHRFISYNFPSSECWLLYTFCSWTIRHLKQQTWPGSRRQPETGNFFADITAHVQHVVTSRCPEVENAKTWGFTSRREREYLIFCFDHF